MPFIHQHCINHIKNHLGHFPHSEISHIIMAERTSMYLLLFLIFALPVCSVGTLVGFYYDGRRDTATSSPAKAISFLKLNKVSSSHIRAFVTDHRFLRSLYNTNVSVDLFLNEFQVEDLKKSKNSAVLWLKTQLVTSTPQLKIKSVVVSCSSSDFLGHKGLPLLLYTLKSIHSILGSFNLHNQVKVSVAFSLSLLENLESKHETDLLSIIDFLKSTESYIIKETDIDGELSFRDRSVQSVIKRATSAASILRYTDLSMVLAIKSSVEKNTKHTGQFTGLFVEVSALQELEKKELKRKEQIFPSFHRQLMNTFEFRRVSHDLIDPPVTTYPTVPITNPSTTPVISPPDASTPAVITVPATNPVTVTPTNPVLTPITVPSTNPVSSPLPVTNPVTAPIAVPGTQPITNPVTTYPSPTGNIPVTTPVTPPVVTNPSATPGQTWCTAKTGALETALQAALDYACGMGGAECSMIQQGASCYNPNTLKNHASYAFNSYYQKNPSPTSCDFGGTAMVVNTNPSTGSCVYPSSSSSLTSTPTTPSSTPTPTPPSSTLTPTPPFSTLTPTPPLSTPTPAPPFSIPTPTTTSSSGAGVPGYGSPPTVLNTSNPASPTSTVYGSDSPPGVNTSVSISAGLRPFVGCIFLATSFITGKIILDM